MNWALADKVKGKLRAGHRVYGYARLKGKRKRVDSYTVTEDVSLIGPEFEHFLNQVEPCEVEVRDGSGYVTSCRLASEALERSESWTEDIDPELLGTVLAIVDDNNLTPRQIVARVLLALQTSKPKS
jgi:hypothetical protein